MRGGKIQSGESIKEAKSYTYSSSLQANYEEKDLSTQSRRGEKRKGREKKGEKAGGLGWRESIVLNLTRVFVWN